MKIEMVAFDLDDTALDGKGRLSEKTRDAFIKAKESGIEPVIASGRSFYSLPEDVIDVPGIRYAICSNGANLFDVKNKCCLRSFSLKPHSVDQIVRVADDYADRVYLDAFTKGVPHSDRRLLDTLLSNDRISEHRKRYLKKTRLPEDNIRGFIEQNKTSLDCMNYNVFDSALFDELYERLGNEVDDIYYTSSIPELIEISYKDCGKGNGLLGMCEYLGIDIKNVAAFGNADNDADMIKAAGLGFAVANSSKLALDAADEIIGPNTEDSVADKIIELIEASKNRSH